MKNGGKDILKPVFQDIPAQAAVVTPLSQPTPQSEVVMTRVGVDRKITVDELKAQNKENPWVRSSRQEFWYSS